MASKNGTGFACPDCGATYATVSVCDCSSCLGVARCPVCEGLLDFAEPLPGDLKVLVVLDASGTCVLGKAA